MHTPYDAARFAAVIRVADDHFTYQSSARCRPELPVVGPYADEVALYSRRNTAGTHLCNVAILASSDFAPWRAAKILYEIQIDFNYLEERPLWEDAIIDDDDGIRICEMSYSAFICENKRMHAFPRFSIRREAPEDYSGLTRKPESLN